MSERLAMGVLTGVLSIAAYDLFVRPLIERLRHA